MLKIFLMIYMTEAQRIIQAGVLPADYLKEEVRCNFLVTSERKKIWAVLLDMLLQIDSVCKKYNLTYFLEAGTLLGAIRHKGMIPWDDDIDIFMHRADYDKFIRLSDEFKEPYFLQTPYTDPEYFYMPARLRNTNTTGMVKTFAYQKFNHGIWLSIFPLDNWELEGGEERYEEIKQLISENSTYMRLTNPHLSEKDKTRVKNYSHRNPMEIYEEIQRIAQQFNDHPTQFIAAAVSAVISYKRKIWYAEDFASSILWDFEGFKFPVPVGYDRFLKIMYGDYMALPPVEERGLHHSGTLFDPDVPYTEYLENIETAFDWK